MKITIEVDDYLARRILAVYDTDGHYTALTELVRLIDTAQRAAIVAKATAPRSKPGTIEHLRELLDKPTPKESEHGQP